jgi:glycosyltransferase involved in cell wall biosynthesis
MSETVSRRPSLAVIVPTRRRPDELERCLAALAVQSRPADEIIVAHNEDDEATLALLHRCTIPLVRPLVVDGGFLGKLRDATRSTSADLLAFADDDVVPPPDWLEKLERRLADDVAAVGGRDIVHRPGEEHARLTQDVGRVTSWGKVIGNHHLGTGSARDVELLKGCNMLFRREALGIPEGLRGEGTQEVHTEVGFCLWARNHGWRLVYDPDIVVDHYPAPRAGAGRPGAGFDALRDAAYNLVACLLTDRPVFFWRRVLFRLLVGDAAHPGLARGVVGIVRGERAVVRGILPSLVGQSQAVFDFARGRRVSIQPVTAAITPRR